MNALHQEILFMEREISPIVKTSISIPGELHKRIKMLAEDEIRTMNEQINFMLREALICRDKHQYNSK